MASYNRKSNKWVKYQHFCDARQMFFEASKRKITKIFFFTFLVRNRKSARASHLTAVQQPFDAHCNTIIYTYLSSIRCFVI